MHLDTLPLPAGPPLLAGVTMSHYTWHSLCPRAQALSLHSFRIAASLAEMVLYVYAGVDVWGAALWRRGILSSPEHLRKARARDWRGAQ